MSGMFGIVCLDGATVSATDLEAMAEMLCHRGPDGVRQECQGSVGLGHAMLHTTEESLAEILPFWDEAAGLAITADARIDNREQLMAELDVNSDHDEVISDSRLILLAFRQWGEACTEHLLGDFAFVIWNQQKQELFCVRDHMGCKPFYYHFSEGLFVFSSSAISIARVTGVAPTLNEGRVADYLVRDLEGIDKTSTFYNEIKRLPPAHAGVCGGSGPKFQRYWELESGPELHLGSDEAYLEAFTRVFSEAVRCRLRCHTEPLATLSGGLDSSTIVAVARDLRNSAGDAPLKTFSGISDEASNCLESQCSLAVAEQGGIGAHFLRGSDIASQGLSLQRVLAHLEDPFDTYMTHLALPCQWAEESQLRVVLDGLDGDLVAGLSMDHPVFLLRQGRWREAWREARGLSRHAYLGTPSHFALFFRAVLQCVVPEVVKAAKRSVSSRRTYRRLLRETSISPDFARRAGLLDRIKAYGNPGQGQDNTNIETSHKRALNGGNLTVALERYERVASYYGVEARHPLLDKRVVEFCVRLPWRLKTRQGWTKYLLRRLASDLLPQQVAWREGVGVDLGWYFNAELQREFASNGNFDQAAILLTTAAFVNDSLTFEPPGGTMKSGNSESVSRWWELLSLARFLQRSGILP